MFIASELLGQYILAFLKEMGAQLLSECIEARVVPCKKAGSVVDGQLVSDMLECSCGDCVGFALPQTVSRAIEGRYTAGCQHTQHVAEQSNLQRIIDLMLRVSPQSACLMLANRWQDVQFTSAVAS